MFQINFLNCGFFSVVKDLFDIEIKLQLIIPILALFFSTSLISQAWDVTVYEGGDGNCGTQFNLTTTATQIANGTMDEFTGDLKIDWYNVNGGLCLTKDVKCILNNNGGIVTGSDPSIATKFVIRFTHTFDNADAGYYDISNTNIDDGKILKIVRNGGGEEILFCSSDWTVDPPVLSNILLNSGDRFEIIIIETGTTHYGIENFEMSKVATAPSIPTMGQWGLIILGLSLLTIGTVVIKQHQLV